MKNWLLAGVIALMLSAQGCGGVPVDASELQEFRAQLIADLRALELPEVKVDASELQALREQLLEDIRRIEERLREIEQEAKE
jgi:flagellar motility protein MotE (MotC chaperone)